MTNLKVFLCYCLIQCYLIQNSVAQDYTDDYLLGDYSMDRAPILDFRSECRNGKCIPRTWRIVSDKFENSADTFSNVKNELHNRDCSLPKYTNEISIINCNNHSETINDMVKEFTLISVPSKSGNRDLQFICVNGKWISMSNYKEESCKNIPKTTYSVEALYYENGRQVESAKAHFRGTVIYPTCPEGTYPNVKEATCGENGKWSVDQFDCLSCTRSYDYKMLSFPIVKLASSYQYVNCRAHIVSPYLALTAASCFEKSPSTKYYIYVDTEKVDGYIDPLKLVEIENIYHSNDFNENANHIALAKVKKRFTFDRTFSHICIDWKKRLFSNPEDYPAGAWSLAKLPKQDSIDGGAYVYVTSCTNSSFSSTFNPNLGEVCVDLGNQPMIMKKGVGFYVLMGSYYVKGIAINTTSEPSSKALFTSLSRYMDWMKEIIDLTNRDYKIPKLISKSPNVHVKNGSISIENVKIDCSNGKMSAELVDGCVLPDKNFHNLDYDVQRWDNKSENALQDFYKHTIDVNNVPEYTNLQNIKCKTAYTSDIMGTDPSICFHGSWYPPIPLCERIQDNFKPRVEDDSPMIFETIQML